MVYFLVRLDNYRLSVLLLAVVDPFLVDSDLGVFVAGSRLVVGGDVLVSREQVFGSYIPRISGVEVHIVGIFGIYLDRTVSDLTSVLVVLGNLNSGDGPVFAVTAPEGRLIAIEIENIAVLLITYQIAVSDIRFEKRLAFVIIADTEIVHVPQKRIVVILDCELRLVGGFAV